MVLENGDTLPYKVQKSKELGRYLVAARDLSPGDLVLTESPLVYAPKALLDPESAPCVGCYKLVNIDVGERCPRCGWPVCSGNCPGLKDPAHHGAECEILAARPECALDDMADYYRHDALLPLRCLLLQKTAPEKWKKLTEMQSHMESRTPGTEAYDEANEFIVEYIMNNFIKRLDKRIVPKITPEDLHWMCGIIDTNALEIRLAGGVELFALFTNTCILEHSCIPTTKHTFNHSAKNKDDLYKITVKVTVPVMKDSHITTMYSHALWGTQARRQHLKDTKCFSCKCLRCSDPTEMGTYLSAMRCLGDGSNPCDGIHLPLDPLDDETEWACNKCMVKVQNSQVNIIVAQMGEEVENVQMMGGSVTMLENLMFKLSMFLHPNHYHIYSIKHSLIQLYGRQLSYMSHDVIEKKIKMCEDLIKITKTLDPGNARLCLYSAVLQHELHSALLIKSRDVNPDGTQKSDEDVKELLKKSKAAIVEALDSLKDEIEETSGRKLYEVILKSRINFERYLKEKKMSL